MSAEIFAFCVASVLRFEGSALAADAGTHGVYSKYGITLETLQAWRKSQRQPVPTSAEDMNAISRDEAVTIIKQLYWRRIAGNRLTDKNVACVLLNAAVLIGPTRATEIVQGILGVQPLDGVFGPITLKAVLLEPGDRLVKAYVLHLQNYLYRLCCQQPARFAKYFNGWAKRTDDLARLANQVKVG